MEIIYNDPQPVEMTYEEIEKVATNIAIVYKFNYKEDYAIDLVGKLGGKLIGLEQWDNRFDSESITVNGNGDFTILIQPYSGIFRDNFYIAHDLGHYFLHSGYPPGEIPIKAAGWGSGKLLEWQANHFAYALLMPREKFTEVANRTKNNIGILSGHFKVPKECIISHLKILHLIESKEENKMKEEQILVTLSEDASNDLTELANKLGINKLEYIKRALILMKYTQQQMEAGYRVFVEKKYDKYEITTLVDKGNVRTDLENLKEHLKQIPKVIVSETELKKLANTPTYQKWEKDVYNQNEFDNLDIIKDRFEKFLGGGSGSISIIPDKE